MTSYSRILNGLAAALLATILIYSSQAVSTPLSLSQVPLILGGIVDPNVMFILDDSGSMQIEMMPDSKTITRYVYPRTSGIYGGADHQNDVVGFETDNILNAMGRSVQNNVLYYDPRITYLPWANSDGSLFPNAVPSCAHHNPANVPEGCRDLTTENNQTAFFFGADGNSVFTSQTFWPAIYWFFNGGDVLDISNYTYVEIRPTQAEYTHTGSARTDCAAPGECTYQEEIQNFANWYTYYRSRILAARAGVGRAFANQGTRLRVGFSSINQGSTDIDGVTSPGSVILGLRQFSGADREAFFDRLYGQTIPIAGTPLRRTLDYIGQYFQRSDNQGPWGATPGTDDSSPQLSCRQSFNVIMTDGSWNGAAAATPGARINVDDNSGPLITHPNNAALNFQYQPIPPFRDDSENTLADVGMFYWNRDLRPDLENNVPTSPADPAYWQHIVNFTVGLAVTGTLNPAVDLPGLIDGTIDWPSPVSDASKIDDLWHTAVNSRGEFFSTQDSQQFSDGLSNILSKITERNASAPFLSLSSGVAGGNSHFFLAEFNSNDWSGRLQAFPINTNGSLGSPVWDAGVEITNQDFNSAREIITLDPLAGNGIPFRFSDLNSTQQAALNTNPSSLVSDGLGSQRVDYLRGDSSQEERNGGTFRDRTINLGDIVNSGLAFVGGANNVYPDVWDDLTIVGDSPVESTVPFSEFRATVSKRQQIVYFGANDGMLHGVDAGTFDANSQTFTSGSGQEELAYVPAILMDELNRLTDVDYTHRYYVDASPTFGEVFFGGSWHTVLGGGLAGGGQAIFALDITDPGRFDEVNAANLVLWEFTDANDPDLGNTYGRPVSLVRLHSGQWAAIFGNGYNNTAPDGNVSTTGNAVLFIVDIETGTLIRKIDTGQGMTQDPLGQNRPNGLSVPAPVDVDGDLIADYVYAGDLYGNLWKFDINSPTPASWGVSFGGLPLFKALDGNGAAQPITVRPTVGPAPVSAEAGSPPVRGSIVYFGTGKYFEVGDNTSVGQPTQSFYAVLDKQLASGNADFSPPTFNRSHLLEQTIDDEILATDTSNPFGADLRLTSDNDLIWHTCAGLPSPSSTCNNDSNGNPILDYLGWRMDLQLQGASSNNGERVVSDPVLRVDRIMFATLIPDADACEAGGSGWLMVLDAATGQRLTVQAFDLNRDEVFNNDDMIDVPDGSGGTESRVVSGKRSSVGTPSTPVIVNTGDSSSEILLQSGSTGQVETTLGSASGLGRLEWQQLP